MKDKGFTDYEECLEIGKRNYISESCIIIFEYNDSPGFVNDA